MAGTAPRDWRQTRQCIGASTSGIIILCIEKGVIVSRFRYRPANQKLKMELLFLPRTKVFHLMGEEIPYGITVEIEKFNTVEGLRKIDATIVVSKSAYKGMIIGAQGAKLKSIGTKARVDMEKLFEGKVFLRLWVKVRKGWVDDSQSVKYFGYE